MRGRRDLPEELVIEILLRLPVEPLLRFKCVSKFWYNLIKSPSFIHQHFHHPHNHTHLLTNSSFIDGTAIKCAISLLRPDDPPIQRGGYIHNHLLSIQHDPINGIFLVETLFDEQIALWNPATKEFKLLPPPPHENILPSLSPPLCLSPPLLGFGLHPVTNVYTVVLIQNYRYKHSVVGLYALDTDSWTHKKIPPLLDSVPDIGCYICSLFLDGVCYWLTGKRDLSLILFDIGNEELEEIQGPPIVTDHHRWGKLKLHNDDSIAAFVYQVSSQYIQVWLMNPKERSWIHKFNIQLSKIDTIRGFWKRDLLIVTTKCDNGTQLAVYNTQNNEIRNLGVYGLDFTASCNYKESLFHFQQRNARLGLENPGLTKKEGLSHDS